MSEGQYTSCPTCSVRNLPNRRACWQCGAILPKTEGIDGYAVATPQDMEAPSAVLDVQSLLDQAEISVPTGTRKGANASRGKGLWQRLIKHQSAR